MSVSAARGPSRFYPGQPRQLREWLVRLRPHWHRDPALPARLETMLRRDRRCGARDRRLYRELVYTTLRYLPWLEPLLDVEPGPLEQAVAWLAADTPDTAAFRAALAGDWPACPAGVAGRASQLGADPDAVLPAWLRTECPEAFSPAQRDALTRRAPLWVRLTAAGAEAATAEFTERGWSWRRSDILPTAVAISDEADVTATEAYRAGQVEIQDLGSQLILASVGPEPGSRWLDACAGAGGKSLQLAELLGPTGRIEAHDVRPAALEELERRAERAGLAGRITRQTAPVGPYDGVLIDAPCSGSGTWRRSPQLKWATSPAQIADEARRQTAILEKFAPLVRSGGRLVYATCSLCRSENAEVVGRFLAAHGQFEPAPFAHPALGEPRGAGLIFWPAAHDGDGYFAASLSRNDAVGPILRK